MRFLLIIICITFLQNFTYAKVSEKKAYQIVRLVNNALKAKLTKENLKITFEVHPYKSEKSIFSKWTIPNKKGKISTTLKFLEIPTLTERAFVMTICHEFGHFLGGRPYINSKFPTVQNMSTEGQADFFSTAACAKKVLSKVGTPSKVQNTLPSYKQFCMKSQSAKNFINCIKEINTIHEVIDTYRTIIEETSGIDFGVINVLEDPLYMPIPADLPGEYPELRCRAKTLLRGFHCKRLLKSGRCQQTINRSLEFRPACWFF